MAIKCTHCGGVMRRTTRIETDIAMQLFGVVLFILGIALLFVFPLGTIAGVVLMIASARMGRKKRTVNRCNGCGYFYQV